MLLFMASGVFLVDSKAKEIASDIAKTSINFSHFTAPKIMGVFHEYLEPGNFLSFKREISYILRQGGDVYGFEISSYSGLLLYNSETEMEKEYEGNPRTIVDEEYLDRIQSIKLSVGLKSGRTIYYKLEGSGVVNPVDINERPIDDIGSSDRIVDIVVPFDGSHAVIYKVSYESMKQRLALARSQIAFATFLGLGLTLFVSFMLAASITDPLRDLEGGAKKIAAGDFKSRVPIKTKDEIGLLAKTFNNMAEQLEVSTKALVYKERVAKELELAVQIQTNLLPKDKLALANLDIAGGLIPASEVGGDAFDYIKVDDKTCMIYLGDVTGHGVAAGIVSSIVNSLIYAFKTQTNLINLVRDVNDVVRRKISAKVFMTMALSLWDDEKRLLTYANAGHPPILYYDSATKKVVDVRLQGMAIGMLEDVEKLIKTQDFTLKPGDVFVMYSDGIVEANNLTHEQFGLPNLKRVVQQVADEGQNAEAIKNSILTEVIEFIAGGEYLDDMTVVVMKGK